MLFPYSPKLERKIQNSGHEFIESSEMEKEKQTTKSSSCR